MARVSVAVRFGSLYSITRILRVRAALSTREGLVILDEASYILQAGVDGAASAVSLPTRNVLCLVVRMKGKGKGDRTGRHHDECPLQFPSLKTADHVRLCPRYSAGKVAACCSKILSDWSYVRFSKLITSVQVFTRVSLRS